MATVLIIEDDVYTAELIKDRLESKGFKTLVAYSAINGLHCIDKEKPDAITLDVHLPDISGVEVLKMIKLDKEKSKTPVIVLTSDDTKQKECKDYNAEGFLVKPINFNKLEEILSNIIDCVNKNNVNNTKQ